MRNDDLGGWMSFLIVLTEERLHDLIGLAAFRLAWEMIALPQVAAAADGHDLDAAQTLLLGQRDNIDIHLASGYELLCLHLPERTDLVPVKGRRFEFQRPRCLFHSGNQPGQDFLVLALQKQGCVVHLLGIGSRANQFHTGRRAAAYLVLRQGRLRCA